MIKRHKIKHKMPRTLWTLAKEKYMRLTCHLIVFLFSSPPLWILAKEEYMSMTCHLIVFLLSSPLL